MQKDVPVEVNGEMAAILQSSRFSPDFKIEILDKQDNTCSESTTQVAHTLGSLWTKCFYFERLTTNSIEKKKEVMLTHTSAAGIKLTIILKVSVK